MPILASMSGIAARAFGHLRGAAALAAIALVNTAQTQNGATGATLVINKPTGAVQNDWMLAINGATGGSDTWSGDTAWNEVLDNGGSPNFRIAHKTAGASEAASYTFTASGAGTTKGGFILALRNAGFDVIGTLSSSAGSPVAPTITVGNANSLLIAVFFNPGGGVSFSTPAGMTPVASDSDASGPSWAVFTQAVGSGASGTRTSTGSAGSFGILLSAKNQ